MHLHSSDDLNGILYCVQRVVRGVVLAWSEQIKARSGDVCVARVRISELPAAALARHLDGVPLGRVTRDPRDQMQDSRSINNDDGPSSSAASRFARAGWTCYRPKIDENDMFTSRRQRFTNHLFTCVSNFFETSGTQIKQRR
jgi:hypothetical protein